jgi:ABC-type glutathione transport system ATPase component
MRGRTTIIVTHSMSLAATADRVLVVEAGRIVQDGAPAALLAQRGPFRRMTVEQTIERPPGATPPVPAPIAPVAPGALGGWRGLRRRAAAGFR